MDANTFQAEVRRMEKLLYRVAWSHLGSGPDAEDAVQDALIRAWEKRDTLRDMRQFRPWLCRILANRAKDMLRRRRHFSFYPLEEATITADLPDVDRPVTEAIGRLKPELRLLITLCYADGMTIREAAEALGIPEGTVKTRLRTARKQLQKSLQVEWEESR